MFGKKTPAQEEGGLQERRQEARGGWNVGSFTDQQQEQREPGGNWPPPLPPPLPPTTPSPPPPDSENISHESPSFQASRPGV